MSKQDLTQYSDQELSLLVFNDEYLYKKRFSHYLRETLEEIFIFTEEQWDVLRDDIDADYIDTYGPDEVEDERAMDRAEEIRALNNEKGSFKNEN